MKPATQLGVFAFLAGAFFMSMALEDHGPLLWADPIVCLVCLAAAAHGYRRVSQSPPPTSEEPQGK